MSLMYMNYETHRPSSAPAVVNPSIVLDYSKLKSCGKTIYKEQKRRLEQGYSTLHSLISHASYRN